MSMNEILKQRLAAHREGRDREQSEPVPMTFDGVPCKVRPLSLEFSIRSGRMPDYLTRIALASDPAATVEREFAAITAEQLLAGQRYQRAAVCRVLDEPRVADIPLSTDEVLSYMELAEAAPAFVDAIFSWVLKGCPVPTGDEGGEAEGLDADDLANFSSGKKRRKRAGAGNRSARKRKTAVGADAAHSKPASAP